MVCVLSVMVCLLFLLVSLVDCVLCSFLDILSSALLDTSKSRITVGERAETTVQTTYSQRDSIQLQNSL